MINSHWFEWLILSILKTDLFSKPELDAELRSIPDGKLLPKTTKLRPAKPRVTKMPNHSSNTPEKVLKTSAVTKTTRSSKLPSYKTTKSPISKSPEIVPTEEILSTAREESSSIVPSTICSALEIQSCYKVLPYTSSGRPNLVTGNFYQNSPSKAKMLERLLVDTASLFRSCHPEADIIMCMIVYPKCQNGRLQHLCRYKCQGKSINKIINWMRRIFAPTALTRASGNNTNKWMSDSNENRNNWDIYVYNFQNLWNPVKTCLMKLA